MHAKNKSPKVSIIIVNYNGEKWLKGCFESLEKVENIDFEIVFVDNGSKDKSLQRIQKYEKSLNLKIIKTKNNGGFTGGNNLGYKHTKGNYILLLNNDTIVTKDFLKTMADYLDKHLDVGGVQSKILSMDDNTKLDSVSAYFTNTGFLLHYGYLQKDAPEFNKTIDVYSAKGACMMFRREVIESVGLLDDDFFLYFEETDFCHRVWLNGWKIRYLPTAVIQHKIGATSNKLVNSFVQFHSFKNRICSYIKNLGIKKLLLVMPIHLFACEVGAFMYLPKKQPKHFIAINKAIWWNIINIKKTLKKRKHIQNNIRKIKDEDFLPTLTKNPSINYYLKLHKNSN